MRTLLGSTLTKLPIEREAALHDIAFQGEACPGLKTCYNQSMGSGRGKTRPVKAAQPQGPMVRFSGEEWDEFAEASGEVSLNRYYLGEEVDFPAKADREKLYAELLADAVNVGAIVLPGPYKARDFAFSISVDKDPASIGPRETAEVFVKGSPGLTEDLGDTWDIRRDPLMSSWALRNAVENLVPRLEDVITKNASGGAKRAANQYRKWVEFSRDNGLDKLDLSEYYLGKKVAAPSDEQYVELLSSMFADGVAVSAVVLPGAHSVEDFEFSTYGRRHDNHVLRVELRGRPRTRTGICKADRLDSREMSEAADLLYFVVGAINTATSA